MALVERHVAVNPPIQAVADFLAFGGGTRFQAYFVKFGMIITLVSYSYNNRGEAAQWRV